MNLIDREKVLIQLNSMLALSMAEVANCPKYEVDNWQKILNLFYQTFIKLDPNYNDGKIRQGKLPKKS